MIHAAHPVSPEARANIANVRLLGQLPPEQLKRFYETILINDPRLNNDREKLFDGLQSIRTAAVVCTIVSAILLVVLPSIFTVTLMGVVSYGAFEMYKVTNNMRELVNKPSLALSMSIRGDDIVEGTNGNNLRADELFLQQVSKGTFFARSLLSWVCPKELSLLRTLTKIPAAGILSRLDTLANEIQSIGR